MLFPSVLEWCLNKKCSIFFFIEVAEFYGCVTRTFIFRSVKRKRSIDFLIIKG